MRRPSAPLVAVGEHDRDLREMLAETLKVSGFRTIEARTGAELSRLARELEVDAILMAERLPGIEVLTAARMLKSEIKRNVPLVVITGHVQAAWLREMEGAGYDLVLRMPFLHVDIGDEVWRLLREIEQRGIS